MKHRSYTPPKTDSLPLKSDGWKMKFPFDRGHVNFRGVINSPHLSLKLGDAHWSAEWACHDELFHTKWSEHIEQPGNMGLKEKPLEQWPKPCLFAYTTQLYRDYNEPIWGSLWTNHYNGLSCQGETLPLLTSTTTYIKIQQKSQRSSFCSKVIPSLKLTARPWKWMVGRWVSFWVSAYFQGLWLLVLRRVHPRSLTLRPWKNGGWKVARRLFSYWGFW